MLLAAAVPVAWAQQAHLVVARSLTLTGALDGFDGRLEVLEDSRITSGVEKKLWGMGDPDIAYYGDAPRIKELTDVPLHHAVLRLKDALGNVVARKTMRRELVRVRFGLLHSGWRTIFVTTDLSIGMGSYAGPLTDLFQVDGGRLELVTARTEDSKDVGPISVFSTLKTEWKLVPAAGGENGQKDILEFACRPADWGSMKSDFVLIYTRYHWDGKEWIEFTRKTHGFWEADEGFPPSGRFPSATDAKQQ
jgi:hypothetical protein